MLEVEVFSYLGSVVESCNWIGSFMGKYEEDPRDIDRGSMFTANSMKLLQRVQ